MYENNLLKPKANIPFTCRDQHHDKVSQQEYDQVLRQYVETQEFLENIFTDRTTFSCAPCK